MTDKVSLFLSLAEIYPMKVDDVLVYGCVNLEDDESLVFEDDSLPNGKIIFTSKQLDDMKVHSDFVVINDIEINILIPMNFSKDLSFSKYLS